MQAWAEELDEEVGQQHEVLGELRANVGSRNLERETQLDAGHAIACGGQRHRCSRSSSKERKRKASQRRGPRCSHLGPRFLAGQAAEPVPGCLLRLGAHSEFDDLPDGQVPTKSKCANQLSVLSPQPPAPTGLLEPLGGCTFHRCLRLSHCPPFLLHSISRPFLIRTQQMRVLSPSPTPFEFRGTPSSPLTPSVSWLRGRERETQGYSRCCRRTGWARAEGRDLLDDGCSKPPGIRPGKRPDNAPDPGAHCGAYFRADSRAISSPKTPIPQLIAGRDFRPRVPGEVSAICPPERRARLLRTAGCLAGPGRTNPRESGRPSATRPPRAGLWLRGLPVHSRFVAQEIAGLLVRSALLPFPHVLPLCLDLSRAMRDARESWP